MGKFLKNVIRIILIGLVVILLILVIDSILNKGKNVHNFVYDVTDGKIQMDLEELDDWSMVVSKEDNTSVEYTVENLEEEWDSLIDGLLAKLDSILDDEVNYDIDDATIFDEKYEIVSGTMQQVFPQEEVQRIDVEVGGCDFSLVQEGTDALAVDAIDVARIQCYAENGTLYIKASDKIKTGNNQERHIYLKIPEGKLLEEASFEIGAGNMNLDGVNAGKISLEIGAGNLQLGGNVGRVMSIECSVGNANILLTNTYTDFNYRVTCDAGKVEIGEESYSGAALEKYVDNGADGKIEVECTAGNVTVDFAK